jgi:IS605 OrfB family transposase
MVQHDWNPSWRFVEFYVRHLHPAFEMGETPPAYGDITVGRGKDAREERYSMTEEAVKLVSLHHPAVAKAMVKHTKAVKGLIEIALDWIHRKEKANWTPVSSTSMEEIQFGNNYIPFSVSLDEKGFLNFETRGVLGGSYKVAVGGRKVATYLKHLRVSPVESKGIFEFDYSVNGHADRKQKMFLKEPRILVRMKHVREGEPHCRDYDIYLSMPLSKTLTEKCKKSFKQGCALSTAYNENVKEFEEKYAEFFPANVMGVDIGLSPVFGYSVIKCGNTFKDGLPSIDGVVHESRMAEMSGLGAMYFEHKNRGEAIRKLVNYARSFIRGETAGNYDKMHAVYAAVGTTFVEYTASMQAMADKYGMDILKWKNSREWILSDIFSKYCDDFKSLKAARANYKMMERICEEMGGNPDRWNNLSDGLVWISVINGRVSTGKSYSGVGRPKDGLRRDMYPSYVRLAANCKRDYLNKMCRSIVQVARKYDVDIIAVERNDMRATNKRSAEKNKLLGLWAPKSVYGVLEYMASEYGIAIREVDAKHTSKVEHRTGQFGYRSENRRRRLFFRDGQNVREVHTEINAARNICMRLASRHTNLCMIPTRSVDIGPVTYAIPLVEGKKELPGFLLKRFGNKTVVFRGTEGHFQPTPYADLVNELSKDDAATVRQLRSEMKKPKEGENDNAEEGKNDEKIGEYRRLYINMDSVIDEQALELYIEGIRGVVDPSGERPDDEVISGCLSKHVKANA